MLFRHVHPIAFLAVLLFAIPAGGGAQEISKEDPSPTAAELDELVGQVRDQMGQIDLKMAALENEEKALMDQARISQRSQFDLRGRILEGDEELRAMAEEIETVQRDLHTLQEAFAQRLAEHPDYAKQRVLQNDVIGRTSSIQRETMELANDRVRLQLELQELEKQRAGLAGETEPEPANDGTTLSAEDSDQP